MGPRPREDGSEEICIQPLDNIPNSCLYLGIFSRRGARAVAVSSCGRRAAPAVMGYATFGLGRPRPIRPAPGVFGRGPSDPTAPHYGGAAEEAGSGSGEDRTRPTCEGRKLSAGLGPAPETRRPTRTEV